MNTRHAHDETRRISTVEVLLTDRAFGRGPTRQSYIVLADGRYVHEVQFGPGAKRGGAGRATDYDRARAEKLAQRVREAGKINIQNWRCYG